MLIWNVPEPESHTATLEQNIFLPPLDFFLSISVNFPEQSRYVTEALRHLHSAQTAAADESRATARSMSIQQQVRQMWGDLQY